MEVLIARIGTKKAVTYRKKGRKKSFTQGSVPNNKKAVTHLKEGRKTQGSVPGSIVPSQTPTTSPPWHTHIQTLQIQSVFGSTLKFKIFTLFF
jgi:hypothetical protein